MLGGVYVGQAYFGQGGLPRTYWGVDSVTRANEVISGTKFFDLVKANAGGTTPQFWGRYIGGFTHPEWELTLDEARYLYSKNCRILVIYRGTTSGTVRTEQHGIDHADRAITFASRLNVPGGVWIYCNTEPSWRPKEKFFKGWFNRMMGAS